MTSYRSLHPVSTAPPFDESPLMNLVRPPRASRLYSKLCITIKSCSKLFVKLYRPSVVNLRLYSIIISSPPPVSGGLYILIYAYLYIIYKGIAMYLILYYFILLISFHFMLFHLCYFACLAHALSPRLLAIFYPPLK